MKPVASEKLHYVYILRCSDDTLYTGYTTDPERRVQEHNGVLPAGARYTRGRRPVTLLYSESFSTRAAAQQHEAALKHLTRAEKLALIASSGIVRQ